MEAEANTALAKTASVFLVAGTTTLVQLPQQHKTTIEKVAALQRTIAIGRSANASTVSNESALGYDENGLPT
jgi:hypothetical protein